MMKIILLLIVNIILVSSTYAQSCTLFNYHQIQSTDELAEYMGKFKQFDVKLMMKYDEGEKIPAMNAVAFTHPYYRSVVLEPTSIGDKIVFLHSSGEKIEISYNKRNIASIDGKIKVCN